MVDVGGGRSIDLGRATVHLAESGDDGPTIVIEAGAGGCAVEWVEVAQLLSPRRVVRVDRPGLGASPYAQVDRDAVSSARLLKELLVVSGSPPPYVLVGHSIAGLLCRAYAYLHPGDLAGVVLVDPFDEDTDDSALPRGFHLMQQVGLHAARGLAWTGPRTVMVKGMAAAARRVLSRPDRPGTDRRLLEIAAAVITPASFRAQADVSAAVPLSRLQLRDLRRRGGFPDVPLRVLTPDSPPVNRMDRLVRAQNLAELHPREAAASSRGNHHVVVGSSHMIHLDQPDVLVGHIEEVAAAW